ncbi:MAG: tetratricopeptide repeat protein [Devosia sp.]|nr:tetratricopeptide repeat protein [Devosia sp.]
MSDLDERLAEGMRQHRAGRLDDAAGIYEAILAEDAHHASALHLRGVVHLQRGDNEQAAQSIRRSLSVAPGNAQALNNYGLALSGLRQMELAIDAFRAATRANPDSADAWANLGNALRRVERYPEAVAAYETALSLAPGRAGIESALGAALAELDRLDDALTHHHRAIAASPDRADYRHNHALSLMRDGREREAEDELRKAIALNPEQGEYHASLARLLRRRGLVEDAVAAYRAARVGGAESKSIEQAVIFNQNYLDLDPVEALADARAFASRLCEGVVRYGDHPNDRDSERRMRVGLVSADFRRHPVGRFLVEPVAASSAEGIEYFAYSGRDNDDELNLRFRKLIPNWRHAGKMRDDELAEQIRRDRIDILVDLSGYTSGERLAVFARKPAPVAVTYLGYFASTGLDAIDYVLANRWLIPEEERRQWVEVPWHLPHSHLCFVEPQAPTPVVAAPRHARGQFTFGSFNNISKYSEGTLAIWAKILAAVPESRLLMRDTATSDGQRSQITDSLVGHGIAPERVVFEPRLEVYEEHLAGYGRLDLALDPFPYNGGTTTVEALYMGVPVLTLHGDRYVAHMSESILRSAGLDEWVAADRDDYVAKAVAAAESPQHLDATRTRLRDQLRESTLFDARVFAGDLEAAFRGMWRAWCLKQ